VTRLRIHPEGISQGSLAMSTDIQTFTSHAGAELRVAAGCFGGLGWLWAGEVTSRPGRFSGGAGRGGEPHHQLQ
jgi:hypothetical protein